MYIARAARGYFGSFYSTVTQTNAGATSANLVTFNTTVEEVGISLVSSTRITFANAGTYSVLFSFQVDKTDGGSDDIDIWLRLDGANVAASNSRVTLAAPAAVTVAAWTFVVTVTAGQYVELAWSSADVDMQLEAQTGLTGPTRPDIASASVLAFQVRA